MVQAADQNTQGLYIMTPLLYTRACGIINNENSQIALCNDPVFNNCGYYPIPLGPITISSPGSLPRNGKRGETRLLPSSRHFENRREDLVNEVGPITTGVTQL